MKRHNFPSRQYGVPPLIFLLRNDPAVVNDPYETAKRYQILPLSRVVHRSRSPWSSNDVFAMEDIKFMTGFNIEPVVASKSIIEGNRQGLGTQKKKSSAGHASMNDLGDACRTSKCRPKSADGVSDSNGSRRSSIGSSSTLAHRCRETRRPVTSTGTYEKEFRVRFRIDGVFSHHESSAQAQGRDPSR